jgi:hypothetical protein
LAWLQVIRRDSGVQRTPEQADERMRREGASEVSAALPPAMRPAGSIGY